MASLINDLTERYGRRVSVRDVDTIVIHCPADAEVKELEITFGACMTVNAYTRDREGDSERLFTATFSNGTHRKYSLAFIVSVIEEQL